MFGIGSTELLVILVVALIVLGPKSLAGFSRTLGKAVGEFRRVSTDFQRTLNAEAAADDARKAAQKKAQQAKPASSGPDIRTDPDLEDNLAPPPDSQVGRALAKARAEAEKAASCSENQGRSQNHGA